MTVFGEAIAALANRADDIRHERTARGVAVKRDDLVKRFVHRGTHEVVHRGVDNQEVFSGAALEVLDARQEDPGVADHVAAGLEEDF